MKHPFAYYQATDAAGGGTPGGDGTPPAGESGSTGAAGTTDAQNPQGSTNDSQATEVKDLPEWAQKLLRELRNENADHRKKAKDATDAAQAAAEEQAKKNGEFQALYEQTKTELEKERTEHAATKRTVLIAKVAAKYKLSDTLAARLQGDTEEAMEADAQELVKALPAPQAPDTERGDRTGKKPPVDKDQTYTFAKPGDMKRTLKRA